MLSQCLEVKSQHRCEPLPCHGTDGLRWPGSALRGGLLSFY
jgi:hypothetical protein